MSGAAGAGVGGWGLSATRDSVVSTMPDTLAAFVSWAFILSAIIDSLYPEIVQSFQKDRLRYERKNRQLYAIVFYVSLFVSAMICLVAKPFILILYGKTYLPAVGPLRIVVWYTAFSYLGVARNAWMVCENRQKYLKYLYISAAALNVVLNFALIPSWGASGAAAASLITQAAIWQAAWPPIPRFPVC